MLLLSNAGIISNLICVPTGSSRYPPSTVHTMAWPMDLVWNSPRLTKGHTGEQGRRRGSAPSKQATLEREVAVAVNTPARHRAGLRHGLHGPYQTWRPSPGTAAESPASSTLWIMRSWRANCAPKITLQSKDDHGEWGALNGNGRCAPFCSRAVRGHTWFKTSLEGEYGAQGRIAISAEYQRLSPRWENEISHRVSGRSKPDFPTAPTNRKEGAEP